MAKDKHAKQKKRDAHNQQIRMANEAQRRQEQAPKLRRPSDLINGFTEDILSLMQHNAGMKMHIQQRVDMARELKESDPLKFNDLRVEAFTELLKNFEPIDKAIRELAGIIGSIEDMQTFNEKMLFLTDNFDALTKAQYEFEKISKKLQEVDFHFNQDLTKLVNPSEQALQDMVDGEGTEAQVDFVATDEAASAVAEEGEVAPLEEGVYAPDGETHTDELTGGLPSGEGEAVGGFTESANTDTAEVASSLAVETQEASSNVETDMNEQPQTAPADQGRSAEFEIPLTQEDAQKVIADQTAPAQDTVSDPVNPVD